MTKDPVIKNTNTTTVASFEVAIDRYSSKEKEKQTDYPRVIVFGKQAQNCERFLKKGLLVGIQGKIQTGKYTNRDGATVYTTEVMANNVEFLEWGNTEQKSNPPKNDPKNDFAAVDDDDIPFR